jgi:4-amino-4-deoxy-L-arabinose transferase-like glycosyltransferase
MPGSASRGETAEGAAGPSLRAAGPWRPVVLLPLLFACLVALHGSLLRLPYFWDEAGYYVPAARDLLLSGDPIPHSTLSNAHPPLVMAYLALGWKLFGYSPLVTRLAMLLVAAFALAGVFRLARGVANLPVAIAVTVCTALYPVFFTQSSLAHLDMAAAAFILWGLGSYLAEQRAAGIVFFSLGALAKETAILAPLALLVWEMAAAERRWWSPKLKDFLPPAHRGRESAALLLPLLPLGLWFAYHYHRTGYVFGNPEFLRYNLKATLNPLRFVIALGLRLWHLLGYLNMFVLTIATALAMRLPPRLDPGWAARKAGGNGEPEIERRRIALPVQAVFGVLIVAHAIAFALLGGAALARYLLPVTPLVIILGVSTLRRRLPWWPAFVAVVCLGFVIALLVNPPYRFAPEDNLAYADYVRLHQAADRFVEQAHRQRRVLTAWPASDELTRPWLGYVTSAVPVVRIENFSAEQLMLAAHAHGEYGLALLFSTKYEPRPLLGRLRLWERIQERYFDYHRDLPPEAAAQILGGRIIYQQSRGGQWVAVVEVEGVENASFHGAGTLFPRSRQSWHNRRQDRGTTRQHGQ